jgi:hypothetical protein
MKTIIIDRNLWSRGAHDRNALLITEEMAEEWEDSETPLIEGTMCCLGFVCLALGATEKQIRGKDFPADTKLHLKGLSETDSNGDLRDTQFSKDAANINDDATIDDEERETQLCALAIENGFKFKFV